MANDENPEPADATDEDKQRLLDAYDLNDDGVVSPVEDARAQLGIVDAHLEEVAEEGGVKGRIADVAHRIVDKLDND